MLPGLAPHHTREGFGSGGRLVVEAHLSGVDDFLVDRQTGLWLLPSEFAERDRAAGEVKLHKKADIERQLGDIGLANTYRRSANILGRTTVTETGCMVGGLGRLGLARQLINLAHADQNDKRTVLDTPEEIAHIRVCSEDDCYNLRHYDLDFARSLLPRRMGELNPLWYTTLPDGRIQTIWGDVLASVEDSMALYIELQRQNYPFVKFKDSKLTSTSISQVRFHPISGCWESWWYYSIDPSLKPQYDGYGRLSRKTFLVRRVDPETGEITYKKKFGSGLAHRVVWSAMGGRLTPGLDLNHLCSYRRCCNPLHLEEVTASTNNQHMHKVQAAIRKLESENPAARGFYLNAIEMAPHHKRARELYDKLAA